MSAVPVFPFLISLLNPEIETCTLRTARAFIVIYWGFEIRQYNTSGKWSCPTPDQLLPEPPRRERGVEINLRDSEHQTRRPSTRLGSPTRHHSQFSTWRPMPVSNLRSTTSGSTSEVKTTISNACGSQIIFGLNGFGSINRATRLRPTFLCSARSPLRLRN